MMRKKQQKAADDSSSSPDPRRIQANVQLDTGRRRASRNGAIAFSVVVFLAAAAIVCALSQVAFGRIGVATIVVAVVAGWIAAMSIHIVMEWEKAVVMRLGKFNRVSGPGVVFTIPLIEFYTLRVDQRVISTYFGAEETLTSDLVPVNVDAIVFWMVFSPKKAAIEVEDYASAVSWMAQATMRKAIGRAMLAEVATRRDQLDAELKDELEDKLSDWGIDVIDVEVRDIVVPKELQPSMAIESVAMRERNARLIMADAETDISEMLADASEAYEGNADAMRLRTMHLAYESVKQSGGTVVVPSAFSEGFVPGSSAGEGASDLAKAIREAGAPKSE